MYAERSKCLPSKTVPLNIKSETVGKWYKMITKNYVFIIQLLHTFFFNFRLLILTTMWTMIFRPSQDGTIFKTSGSSLKSRCRWVKCMTELLPSNGAYKKRLVKSSNIFWHVNITNTKDTTKNNKRNKTDNWQKRKKLARAIFLFVVCNKMYE